MANEIFPIEVEISDFMTALNLLSESLRSPIMTCSQCSRADRLPGQRWCRVCLTAYARDWRARRRLEKPHTIMREA